MQRKAIKEFVDKVRWLHEPEYGDFKRKLGLYIARLEQELGPEVVKPEVLSQLKQDVVYRPSGDIEATRKRVIDLVNQL